MPTFPTRPPRRGSRLRLPRRPVPFWLLALVAAAVTALLVGRIASGAAADRSRWGATLPTVVATADVASGEPLGPDDVAVRMLPVAVVPPGALRTLPAGAVAAAAVHEGEAVLRDRLVGPGSSAVAARLPEGTRGVALPADTGLPLEIDDRVDVLATFDAGVSGDGEPTFPVARRGVVVHVGDDAVTVAVPEAAAPRVAYALAAGTVTLVLSGTSSPR